MISGNSIKGRLVLWIFLSVTSLFIILGLCLYQQVQRVVFESVDNTLHSKLQLVKGLMHPGRRHDIKFEVDEIAMGDYVIPRSGHYYQILVNGETAAVSESLADKLLPLSAEHREPYADFTGEWLYNAVGPAEEPVRVVRHDFDFLGKSITILVAESLTDILAMMEKIRDYFFISMAVMIVLVGGVGFLIVSSSLRPLASFSAAIEKITHKTLDERLEEKGQVRELRGLAASFNALLSRLQAAFEAEKHLIADATHELKTPLAVIKAHCDITLQKQRTPEEYSENLREIREVATLMQRQVSGLLTLARLDSGILCATNFKEISLNACLADALRLVRQAAAGKGVRIEEHGGKEEITLCGDRETLTEALVNILDNAIKYNVTAGSVVVAAETRDDRAIVTVRDSGVGIREEELAKIFDRFYRAANSGSTEGTGLGLSIAKAVIRAHDGVIRVESEISRGSCFTVLLPLSMPERLKASALAP